MKQGIPSRRATRALLTAMAAVFAAPAAMAQQTPTQPGGGISMPAQTGPAIALPSPGQGGRTDAGVGGGAGLGGPTGGPQGADGQRGGPPGRNVTTITATSGAVQISGKKGTFEPILGAGTPEVELPDTGDTMDIPYMTEPVQVTKLLDLVVQATDWSIVTSAEVEKLKVRLALTSVKPRQLLEALQFYGVTYEWEPESQFLYVMTAEEYASRRYGKVERKEFDIEYAAVPDMVQILQTLLSKNGKLIPDPRTGRIIVWDTSYNIEEMEKTVEELDVQLEPSVFPLAHLAAEDLADTIAALLSERGMAHADPRVNTVVVTDIPSRVEQISQIIEALDQPLETRTWTLSYVEPDDVAERLENIIPEEMGIISTDEMTHQVSLQAIPERLDEVDKLIKEWDVKPKQVHIEAYLVSANSEVTRNLGISWHYFDERDGDPFALRSGAAVPDFTTPPEQGQRLTIGALPYQVPQFYPLTTTRVRDINGNLVPDPEFQGNRLSVVLNYLDKEGDIQILSRPRVTVLDGQEAIFQNIEEIPYQEGGIRGYYDDDRDNNRVNRSIVPLRVQFAEVGTILSVLPRVAEDGNIAMEIAAEDSSAEMVTVTFSDQQSTIPQRLENTTETKVLVHDGETIAIGGLRGASIQDDVERVPFLGELPFVGRLFSSTQKDRTVRELLIFITPRIVDEYTEPEAMRLAELDADAAESFRQSRKSVWERMAEKVNLGEDEIIVAVGERGGIYAEGNVTTVEEFVEGLALVDAPARVTVVIRAHPNAPEEQAAEMTAAAEALGFDVEYDDNIAPFVPNLPPTPAL